MMERFPSRSQKNRLWNPNPFAPSFRRIFPSNEHQWAVGIVRFYRSTLAWNFREIICGAWIKNTVSSILIFRKIRKDNTFFNTQAVSCRLPCTASSRIGAKKKPFPPFHRFAPVPPPIFQSLMPCGGCGLLWLFQRFQRVFPFSSLLSFLRSLDPQHFGPSLAAYVEILSGMRLPSCDCRRFFAVLQQHLLHLKTIGFTLESWLGDRFVGVYNPFCDPK